MTRTLSAAHGSILALASALALVSCKSSSVNHCASDLTCAAGFSCDPNTGACACDSDSSCAADQFCNSIGFCQARLLCQSSADCGTGTFCDAPSGTCIAAGACTIDVQCALGQVCNNFTCVPGCRLSGDCPLSQTCAACAPGTPHTSCPVANLCISGHCDSQLSCAYGDVCASTAEESDGGAVCQHDTRGPFCQTCVGSPGTPSLCDHNPANYCLIDPSLPLGQAYYCGVDCGQGQECPNGYYCHDVRIVTARNCDTDAGVAACKPTTTTPGCDPAKTHAPADGGPGLVNDDCLAALTASGPLVGAECDPDTKSCAAQCLGTGEVGVQAFCSCIQDRDCPQDVCESATHACSISGRPCLVGAVPDDCQSTNKIFCVKAEDSRLGDVGYCRIGQNCAPSAGFTCAILRDGGH